MPDTTPARPLGRRPADPLKLRRAVDATPFLRTVPWHPPALEAPVVDWPMLWNDQAGVCVPVSLRHAHLTLAARLGLPTPVFTLEQLLDEYRVQNPGFRDLRDAGGPNDGGMIMQAYLEDKVRRGDLLAFGRVDHDNEAMLKAATWTGAAICTGETLTYAQAEQLDHGQPWDYAPGYDLWGGHATAVAGYDPDTVAVVTWGEQITGTDLFVERQVEEAWFLLFPDADGRPLTPPGFDLPGFAAAVAEVTDGKVVVSVPDDWTPTPPPGPIPVPEPEPEPGPPAAGCMVPNSVARLVRRLRA